MVQLTAASRHRMEIITVLT